MYCTLIMTGETIPSNAVLVDKDDTQETDDVEFEQLLQWGVSNRFHKMARVC
jgi:hypothetical protein